MRVPRYRFHCIFAIQKEPSDQSKDSRLFFRFGLLDVEDSGHNRTPPHKPTVFIVFLLFCPFVLHCYMSTVPSYPGLLHQVTI